MNRPRLLLISPPTLYSRLGSAGLPSRPHLYSLAGYVRDIAQVEVVDLDISMGVPESLQQVDSYLSGLEEHLDLRDVDLVAISCWTTFHYLGTVAVARFVRQQAPSIPIIVGGHHPTGAPNDFINEQGLFDFVVRGDGEYPLRALCLELPGRPPVARVVEGRRFEMSDTRHIDWATYPWHHQERRIMWLNLSRGCPFECAFCVGRSRSVSYPVEEVLSLLERLAAQRGPELLFLSDPVFAVDARWARSLLDGLDERGLKFQFWAETRADLPTPELLDRLGAHGFWVDFGLDTGSPAMVHRLNKHRSAERYLERARRTLQYADAIGLPHSTYLLFNHPGETPSTVKETMNFVESLAPGSGPISGMVACQSFFMIPGTEIHRRMAELESQFGTVIRHPTWWQEEGDQERLSTDILPSSAFLGQEEQLTQWGLWQGELNMRWAARQVEAVRKRFREMFAAMTQ